MYTTINVVPTRPHVLALHYELLFACAGPSISSLGGTNRILRVNFKLILPAVEAYISTRCTTAHIHNVAILCHFARFPTSVCGSYLGDS